MTLTVSNKKGVINCIYPTNAIMTRVAGQIVAEKSRTSLHQSKGNYIITHYKND